MSKEAENDTQICPECFGATIVFKGKALESMYMICPRWKEPGHLSEGEIEDKLRRVRQFENPSGRCA